MLTHEQYLLATISTPGKQKVLMLVAGNISKARCSMIMSHIDIVLLVLLVHHTERHYYSAKFQDLAVLLAWCTRYVQITQYITELQCISK